MLSSCWQRTGEPFWWQRSLLPDAMLRCCTRKHAMLPCEALPRRLQRLADCTLMHLCVQGDAADEQSADWLHLMLVCISLISNNCIRSRELQVWC